MEFIPKSVTHLSFGYRFNEQLGRGIPETVTHLTFGSDFNKPLIMQLPHGSKFTYKCIPSSVTHLTFGYDFNQELGSNISLIDDKP